MRRSTLFVSAVLTVFMLATLFGVVSAYQGMVASTQSQPATAVATQPATDVPASEQFMSVAPAQTGVVTPEQATTLAMQMINRSDVYSVESTTYETAPAYLVTFSSGDLVYVSPSGQILAVTKIQPVVVTQPNRRHNNDDGGNQTTTNNNTSGGDDQHEHEGGDD